jgi:DNA-directed RNA polymerase specialized sigma24 family protein
MHVTPEDTARLLMLRDDDGKNWQDIAEAFEKNVATMQMRYMRATRKRNGIKRVGGTT